jgi:hypothetical protein
MANKRIYFGQPCSIGGCNKPARTRDWCGAHYSRWIRNGDPLGGGTSPGELLRYYRDIVLTYEGDECLIWPFARTGAGYGHLKISRKQQFVHRLVCHEEHGPPPTTAHLAAHSCGNGHLGCVARKHLSWKTPSQNYDDSIQHGTAILGDSSHFSKLNEAQARHILEMKGKKSVRELANTFGVTNSLVYMIHNRKIWRTLDEPPRKIFVPGEIWAAGANREGD